MVRISKIAEAISQILNVSGLCLYLFIFRADVLMGFYVELKMIRWASYENKLHQLEMFDLQQNYPPMISKDEWIPYWMSIRERIYAELSDSFEQERFVPNLLFDKEQQKNMKEKCADSSVLEKCGKVK